MTKPAKKKLAPDAWVIEWPDIGEEVTKQVWRAALGNACGAKVRPLYYGWGAAACCPMVVRR